MDLFARLLLRMAHWARHPPSPRWVIMAALVVLACLSIAAFEHYFGWPEALTTQRLPRWPAPR